MATTATRLGDSIIDPEAVRPLRAELRGDILEPGDTGYDDVRRVFNAMIDRRPALIVQPADAEDVRRAVLFAHEHTLLLSVKGGGHNVAGSAVCAGGLMLDLSKLKQVEVDPVRRVAVAQPGLRLADLDHATQAHGLATPLGVVSVTGIAGLTLGGGLGWLNGKHGLALDNLLSAEVVTADGDLLRVGPEEHPDLFWAIRGGSGNFGVVTSFVYRLHPVGPVLGGFLRFPADCSREALHVYDEFARTAPDELSTIGYVDADTAGRTTVGVSVCWSGRLADGERILQPLRDFGPPIEDTIGPMSYRARQTTSDGNYPEGRQQYWKSRMLSEMSDAAIDMLLGFAAKMPSGETSRTSIALQHLHGAAARVDPAATAFPHRRDEYDFLVLSQWTHPTDAERYTTWTRDFFAAMQPFTECAVYVNGLGAGEDSRVREAYGTNYPRLAAIKARYDPDNLFRANQNIQPAT